MLKAKGVQGSLWKQSKIKVEKNVEVCGMIWKTLTTKLSSPLLLQGGEECTEEYVKMKDINREYQSEKKDEQSIGF